MFSMIPEVIIMWAHMYVYTHLIYVNLYGVETILGYYEPVQLDSCERTHQAGISIYYNKVPNV